jgi:sporulation protein YlmC with PRC-barrel domain
VEEGELVGLREMLKLKVFDLDGKHIGHVQDMAIERRLEDPEVCCLGVHLLWTDHVGEVELVRRVEDIVVLVPWDHVARAADEEFRLAADHLSLPIQSARGRWLLRRDVLNKQMVDPRGNRIQRVDDVLLRAQGDGLRVAGLEVSKGLMITSSTMRRYMAAIRRKHFSRHDTDVIPWEAVSSLEEDSIVLSEEVQV